MSSPLHFRLWLCLAVAVVLTACGGRLESRTPGEGSSNLKNGNESAGPGATGVEKGTGFAFIKQTLECVVEVPPLASQITVFVDATGNFYPGFEPPAFPVRILAGKAGGLSSFAIVDVLRDPIALRLESTPVVNGDLSQSILIRGLSVGAQAFAVRVRAADQEAICQGTFSIRGVRPPDPAVLVRANGVETALPIPLSAGEKFRLSWSSANTRACVRSVNGGAPTPITLNGEVEIEPSVNATNATRTDVYTVACLGAGSTESRQASVNVGVNPVPVVSFQKVGGGVAADVASGGAVDVVWTSQFATGGCTLTEGNNVQQVAPNGNYRRENVLADTSLVLSCRDRNQGVAVGTVTIRIRRPSVSITANGAGGNYVKPFGAVVNVAWNSQDTTSCAVSPVNGSGLSGSMPIADANIRVSTTYSVTCQSSLGPVAASVQVQVNARWYQATEQVCSSFCAGMGKANTYSAEGYLCTSGENIPASAKAAGIVYTKGCWPNCNPNGATGATSDSKRCYRPGQKKDSDRTDLTMGCYCWG